MFPWTASTVMPSWTITVIPAAANPSRTPTWSPGTSTPEHPYGQLGSMEALQAVRQYPVRIKCALLPWAALEQGIRNYYRHNNLA